MRDVLVLVNPKSGLPRSFTALRNAVETHWDVAGTHLYYQFSKSKEDGIEKAERAVAQGVRTILVAGGDGTISTIGRVLVDTDVAIGAIPLGSGNGFARHFDIPLGIADAVKSLASAHVKPIDVGVVDGIPFLVTCSLAWDAAIVRSFEKWPVRGFLPYVLAGVQEIFEFSPQDMSVAMGSGHSESYHNPVVFTIANLTQFGGGAQIAPTAKADDGYLELVVVLQRELPKLLPNMPRLFDGSLTDVPGLHTRRFRGMTVTRATPGIIQVDGEVVDAGREVRIDVKPGALNVLVPGP